MPKPYAGPEFDHETGWAIPRPKSDTLDPVMRAIAKLPKHERSYLRRWIAKWIDDDGELCAARLNNGARSNGGRVTHDKT